MTARRVLAGFGGFLAGISTGWLVGLSFSPTIAGVLGIVVAAIVTTMTAMSGLRGDVAAKAEGRLQEPSHAAATSLTVLIIGIGVGAGIGLWVRTHDSLAPRRAALVEAWVALGIERGRVVRDLYTKEVSIPVNLKEPPGVHYTTLYTTVSSECDRLAAFGHDDLRRALQASPDTSLRRLETVISDDRDLVAALEILCGMASR